MRSIVRLFVSVSALALPLHGQAIGKAGSGKTLAATSSNREVVQLAEGWRFRQDDAIGGAEQPGFSDGAWESVSLPHTWSRAGYYLDASESHLHRADTVNKKQGIGWYRLSFTPPAGARGKRAWLEFDAASRTAEVWLNGVRLGGHEGGFSRFRLDATAALRPGQPNLLVVKTDSSPPKPGSATANTLPLTGDFFIHGGLYRPARLVLTDPVHIDLADFGGPGVYAQTRSIAGGTAEVGVRTKLRNDGGSAASLTLSTRLIDARGRVAAAASQTVTLAAGGATEVLQSLSVRAPRLWQGVADPYLYRLTTEIRSADGRRLDSIAQNFGIRTMKLDPERGFLLNGKPLKLHGVGLHQDVEGKGWAMSEKDVADTVSILRDMGANTIRLTHYQHGTPIHDLADRHGLVLWDEIALVTAWTLANDEKQAPPGIAANARQQLQELIRQNYNHASVAVWGIANEVDFGPGRPDFLGQPPPTVPDPLPLLRMLNGLAKAEDPGRSTTLATCCEDRGMAEVPIAADATDAAGANRYFGWYYARPAELSAHLDQLHAKRPNQPLSVSEYGAGGAITMHSDDPLGGPIDMGGPTQPEEYQAWVHEQSWPILKSKPYLWATWLWNGFDFGTTVRREGDSQDINTKGLVTYDRKVRKDAFYFYKANWTETPTVHITGRRYVDRAYPVTDVRVYSNARSTELRHNGRSLGARTDCPDRICVWRNVRLGGGENRLVAIGAFASGRSEDRVEWRLDPASRRSFRIDSGTILAARAAAGRFGSDAFFEGGSAGTADMLRRGRPPVLAAIAGSPDRDLLATFREGNFGYRLPLENGRYTVTLTFIEPKAAPGERQFDVIANGAARLTAFDIAAAAGAKLTAVRRSFPVEVTGDGLDLAFKPIKGMAIVSAIEILPQ